MLLVFSLLLVMGFPAAARDRAKVYYAMDSNAIGPARSVQARVLFGEWWIVSFAVSRERNRLPEPGGPWFRRQTRWASRCPRWAAPSAERIRRSLMPLLTGSSEAGVPAKNIIIWDKSIEDLLATGFKKDGARYILEGIDPKTGYDQQFQVSAPVLGKLIWGDSKFGDRSGRRFADLLSSGEQLSSQSYFAKVLTTKVTKVINVPSLADSYLTGIHGGIVNMTLSNIDNWRRFAKSASAGDSYISEIYADPMIRDKVVLILLDALILQYAGGPFPNPNFSIQNCVIFASK